MKKMFLLLEGGVAGHLSHLYDNRDLTFNEIKHILRKANSGKLVGTEKTDGYNIYLGCRGGLALYARNKGDMVAGGRNIRDLKAREFAGGDQVKDVYLNSFSAFQKAIDSMSGEEQAKIFGQRGEIFYNTEIQGPGASNVVNYDANVLSIHHGGHKRYDRATNTVETVDVDENSNYLNSLIDRFEVATADEPFSVQRTAVMQLQGLSDDTFLETALTKMNNAGFSGSMTIGEYIEEGLKEIMSQELSYFGPSIREQVIDYIIERRDEQGKKVANLRNILKGMNDDQKDYIRDIVKAGSKFIKKIIFPIEDAIHDFSVELLKGMESAYILDNSSELRRLKAEVRKAIEQISDYSGPGAEEAHEILKQQLMKLKSHDNINTTVEGFVFQHGDTLYKFTGNFAPVNQLLGLFKYGRGTAPPIMAQGSQQLSEGVQMVDLPSPVELYEVLSNHDSVGVFPGGFKPPHKGHFEAAASMAQETSFPIVIMGPGAKSRKRTINGKEVTFDVAAKIWEIYANDAGVNLYIIKAPAGGNPMHIAYDILQNAQPGQTIRMVAGAKDGGRFKGQAENYRPDGVSLEVDPIPNIIDPDTSKPMSATTFREAVERGENIEKYIPETSLKSAETIARLLNGEPTEETEVDALPDLIQEFERRPGGGPGRGNPIDAFPDMVDEIGQKLSMQPEEVLRALEEIIMGGADETMSTAADAVQSIMNPGSVMEPLSDMAKELKSFQDEQRGKEKMASLRQTQSQLEEISAAGGGAVVGGAGNLDDDEEDKREPTIFREEEELTEAVLNYLLQTAGK